MQGFKGIMRENVRRKGRQERKQGGERKEESRNVRVTLCLCGRMPSHHSVVPEVVKQCQQGHYGTH